LTQAALLSERDIASLELRVFALSGSSDSSIPIVPGSMPRELVEIPFDHREEIQVLSPIRSSGIMLYSAQLKDEDEFSSNTWLQNWPLADETSQSVSISLQIELVGRALFGAIKHAEVSIGNLSCIHVRTNLTRMECTVESLR